MAKPKKKVITREGVNFTEVMKRKPAKRGGRFTEAKKGGGSTRKGGSGMTWADIPD